MIVHQNGEQGQSILCVHDLKVHFSVTRGVLFVMRPGETLELVGDNGSGKSVMALSLLRSLPVPPGRIVAGRVCFVDEELLDLSLEEFVADESTIALDVTIQTQILVLINRLKDDLGMSILLIDHDLVVMCVTNSVLGEALFNHPCMSYTSDLRCSTPHLNNEEKQTLPCICALLPDLTELSEAYPFASLIPSMAPSAVFTTCVHDSLLSVSFVRTGAWLRLRHRRSVQPAQCHTWCVRQNCGPFSTVGWVTTPPNAPRVGVSSSVAVV